MRRTALYRKIRRTGIIQAVILVIILSFAGGCRSLPPPGAGRPAAAVPSGPGQVVWSALEPGLDLFIFNNPDIPLVLYALRADLSDPRWELVFTEPGGPGNWEMEGCTTSRFLEKTGSRAAVNGAPFEPYRYFLSGAGQNIAGLYIWQGKTVSAPRPDYAVLTVGSGGKVEIRQQSEFMGGSPGIRYAVAGFRKLLSGGEVDARTADGRDGRDCRTALGLSEDGKTLFLMTADGRRPGYSRGLTLEETGEWLRILGAWEGMNLDGGGSTVMVLADDRGRAKVLNRPVNRRGLPQRIVASHIGLRRL